MLVIADVYKNSLLPYAFLVTVIISLFLLQCFLFAASQDYPMLYQVQYIACRLLIRSGLKQLRKKWPFDWKSWTWILKTTRATQLKRVLGWA